MLTMRGEGSISVAMATTLSTLTNTSIGSRSRSLANDSLDLEVYGLGGGGYMDTVISGVLLPVVCLCGIAGILLTIIVLSHKHMSTSTNCYLLALSSADLVFLALLTTSLLEGLVHSEHSARLLLEIYIAFAAIFMKVTLMASIWLTVTLTVERYVAICQPFLASKVCSVKRARLVVSVVFLVSVACHLIMFFEHRVASTFDRSTNQTHVYLHITDLSTDDIYRTVYPWIVDVALVSFIPFLLLLVLNTLLIWEVRKSTAYMQRHVSVGVASSVAQKEEVQVTVMLIVIVIVFFICQAPYVVYTALLNHMTASAGLLRLHAVTKLLLTLKSAVNFVIYCWFSEKFWTTLKRILHPHHCCPCLPISSSAVTSLGGVTYCTTARSYHYTTSYTARHSTTAL